MKFKWFLVGEGNSDGSCISLNIPSFVDFILDPHILQNSKKIKILKDYLNKLFSES